jgi:hypothetical protein
MPALTFSVNSLLRSCGAPARVFDDVDAARELACGIRQHLCRARARSRDELVGALLDERLEANMTRARASGVVAAQPAKAACAASTARPTRPALANGTRAPSAPVAGV